MAIEKKLSGGREAMVGLRSSGPMPVERLLKLMEASCGASDAKYRARRTYDVLLERGAFVVRNGIAYPEYAGGYSAVIDRLSKGMTTTSGICEATGLEPGEVTAILRDLNNSGVAVKLPKSKGRLRWSLLSQVPDDFIGATSAVGMYENMILEMCSKEAKTSEELSIGIGETLPVTRGYLRCLSARGLITWAMPSPDSQKLWYSSEEAKQDAYRLIDEIRSEKRPSERSYPKLSGAPSIKGRNPDYMSRDSMRPVILSCLGDRVMTESELMAGTGRTRSIRSIMLEMWKDGLVDGAYDGGMWKWKKAAEGD